MARFSLPPGFLEGLNSLSLGFCASESRGHPREGGFPIGGVFTPSPSLFSLVLKVSGTSERGGTKRGNKFGQFLSPEKIP